MSLLSQSWKMWRYIHCAEDLQVVLTQRRFVMPNRPCEWAHFSATALILSRAFSSFAPDPVCTSWGPPTILILHRPSTPTDFASSPFRRASGLRYIVQVTPVYLYRSYYSILQILFGCNICRYSQFLWRWEAFSQSHKDRRETLTI